MQPNFLVAAEDGRWRWRGFGWPRFRSLSRHPDCVSTLFKKGSRHPLPRHAADSPYRVRLSALGAADKIIIGSLQFSSLICPTQSAKAGRVSILVCCIDLIYCVSTGRASPAPLGSAFFSPRRSLRLPIFGHKAPSFASFCLSFRLRPSSSSEGLRSQIRPVGFFNVSLEAVSLFLSPEPPTLIIP